MGNKKENVIEKEWKQSVGKIKKGHKIKEEDLKNIKKLMKQNKALLEIVEILEKANRSYSKELYEIINEIKEW